MRMRRSGALMVGFELKGVQDVKTTDDENYQSDLVPLRASTAWHVAVASIQHTASSMSHANPWDELRANGV